VTNTLAYYNTDLIIAAKSFILMALGSDAVKLFAAAINVED
jgi:hypothetical protein